MVGRTTSITNVNGYLTYWTGITSVTGSLINGEANVNLDLGILHRIPLDAYKDWADWGSTAMKGGLEYIVKQRTDLYNSGYWIDNLGNTRSVNYAGRARGSLIGLRSSYVNTTAMYGKYATRAGYVGYAISAAQIGYGVYQDKGKFGVKAQLATANVAGGMAGAWMGAEAGAWMGMKTGATVGVWFEGVGAVPGAAIGGLIGGIVGGILGGKYGGDYAEDWASGILNKPDQLK
ncbi:hypothetical protein QWZ06_21535 [Chryseobacterium tructae]|nr:hypothetical protein [Chryseobacterium tructae]MDN3694665.1 hypothetical protein [Chryseobacterium tructae]